MRGRYLFATIAVGMAVQASQAQIFTSTGEGNVLLETKVQYSDTAGTPGVNDLYTQQPGNWNSLAHTFATTVQAPTSTFSMSVDGSVQDALLSNTATSAQFKGSVSVASELSTDGPPWPGGQQKALTYIIGWDVVYFQVDQPTVFELTASIDMAFTPPPAGSDPGTFGTIVLFDSSLNVLAGWSGTDSRTEFALLQPGIRYELLAIAQTGWELQANSGVWTTSKAGVGHVDIDYDAKLRAVPEPASMLALGLGAIALVRRRRQW